MIGKLSHEETLTQLGWPGKQLNPGIEHSIDQRRFALVHILIQLRHGYRVEIVRIQEADKPPLFLPRKFIVEFRCILCYIIVSYIVWK